MSQVLRDLMVRAAEDAPEVRVDPGTWRAARRARRRERVLATMAAAAVLVGVVGIASQAGSLLPGSGEAAPAEGHREPAMPSRVHAVPEHLDGERPDGTWSYPRAETLEIGVAAVVFTTSGYAPVAVSALDGEYHLLDLPGHERMSGFRFEDGSFALSPDGRRLAYTWNKPASDVDAEVYVPSGIRIVDLLSGEVESHQVREGFGVFAHGFAWSPNGRYLTYNMQIANTSQSGTSGTRNFFVERLDTRTGERLKASGLPMTEVAPAVTDAGTVVTGTGTTLLTWQPDQGRETIDLQQSPRWRGSLTGFGAVPGEEKVYASAGLEYSRIFVGRLDSPFSFQRLAGGMRWLSPVGPVDADSQAVLEETELGTSLWTSGPAHVRSGVLVEIEGAGGAHYSFATTLLQRPTRDFPAPQWPMSTTQKAVRGAILVGVALIVLMALAVLGRRYRRPAGLLG
ncbi:MAG TPA: hypothetical protein VLB29_08255 [Nocardioidaceae bacterium]|nr:hypothetical protein [Nocardioidaceae bacterium]